MWAAGGANVTPVMRHGEDGAIRAGGRRKSPHPFRATETMVRLAPAAGAKAPPLSPGADDGAISYRRTSSVALLPAPIRPHASPDDTRP